MVGLTPVLVAPANPGRVGLHIRNVGKQDAYLGCSGAMDTTVPVVIAKGAIFCDSLSWDAWWGCCDNKAGTTLTLIEVTR